MVLFVPPPLGHQNNTVSYSNDSGSQSHLRGRKINGVNYTPQPSKGSSCTYQTLVIITFYITYDPMKTNVRSMNIISSGQKEVVA